MLVGLLLLLYPQSLSSETFKSEAFLTWERSSQDFYIRTSIGMAGFIAARNDNAHARCLEDWYYSDETAANEAVLAAMRRFPDYHPRGVIVAVIEKRCGSFTFSNQ